MTVQTALQQGTHILEDAGIAVPRLTAEVLLGHAMRVERVYFFAHPEQELREVEWLHYGRYLHERLGGKPTQYITKHQEFYSRDFRVTPDVLIPRPETEHVVEVALRRRARRAARARCRHRLRRARRHAAPGDWRGDMGDGHLAGRRRGWPRATPHAWARGVHFVVCDLMEAIAAGTMDLIVSNPPYVPLAHREGSAARGPRFRAARRAVRRPARASNSTTASWPMPRACCGPAAG